MCDKIVQFSSYISTLISLQVNTNKFTHTKKYFSSVGNERHIRSYISLFDVKGRDILIIKCVKNLSYSTLDSFVHA